jgi:hypothetical protein
MAIHPDSAAIVILDARRRQKSSDMAVPIDERARRWLAKMEGPRRAKDDPQDSHAVVFQAACVLIQGFALTKNQALPILAEYCQRSDEPWTEQELLHKLDGAEAAQGLKRKTGVLPRGCLINANGFKPSKEFKEYHKIEPPKKPEFEETALSKFAAALGEDVDLVWLANRSSQDPCIITPAKFLELIYRSGEKVLIFTDNRSQGDALWPKDKIPERGPHGVWFLGQPVDGEYHPNPRQGSMSRRSEEAVTSWRYLVIESDQANLKLWLAAIVQFPLRIAAIYSSGGRSIHALVKIDARTKGEWDSERDALKNALVVLGGDAGAMTAVRLTRLPGCYRGRELQKLLFINPDPPLRPICELAPRRDVLKPWLEWAGFGISDADETNGEALTHALQYYAPVSAECREALKNLRRK